MFGCSHAKGMPVCKVRRHLAAKARPHLLLVLSATTSNSLCGVDQSWVNKQMLVRCLLGLVQGHVEGADEATLPTARAEH